MADDRQEPSSGRQILVNAVGGMLGNLLSAAVLYLLLVAGQVIPANTLLVAFAVVVSFVGTVLLLSVVLWSFGRFQNHYTSWINGRKGVLLGGVAIFVLAFVVVLFFVARSLG